MEDEFFEIIKSVKKIGTKNALDLLKKAQTEVYAPPPVIISTTISMVIKEWGGKYTMEDLFQQNVRGEVVLARNTIIVIVSKLTKFDNRKLYDSLVYEINIKHQVFNVRSVRRALCEFRDLDSKNKFDKVVIDRTEKVLENVVSKIQKKNKK